jgi:hypothetical protein
MKITSHKDLTINKEYYLGNDQICNRYLRRDDNIIEVQRIVRIGKNGETQFMTLQEFDNWRNKIKRMAGNE